MCHLGRCTARSLGSAEFRTACRHTFDFRSPFARYHPRSRTWTSSGHDCRLGSGSRLWFFPVAGNILGSEPLRQERGRSERRCWMYFKRKIWGIIVEINLVRWYLKSRQEIKEIMKWCLYRGDKLCIRGKCWFEIIDSIINWNDDFVRCVVKYFYW